MNLRRLHTKLRTWGQAARSLVNRLQIFRRGLGQKAGKVIQDEISAITRGYWRDRRTIGGAFRDIDLILFDRFLTSQRNSRACGDLLEIGVLRGKSAIVLGLHTGSDEQFIACDVFEDPGTNKANTLENQLSYHGVTKTEFLDNYGRFVSGSPQVIHDLSSSVPHHVKPRSLRFVHIDGGHLYDVVRDDLTNVKPLMNENGLVVMDDFRAIHTPGVAAATWNAVVNHGLIPICMSEFKFYGTWSSKVADRHVADLTRWLKGHPSVNTGSQRVAEHETLIIGTPSILTRRGIAKSLIPPFILDRLRSQPAPHLGE